MKVRGSLQTDYNSEKVSYLKDNGVANAFSITVKPAINSHSEALRVRFKAKFSNTGPCTINVNGLGVKPVKKGGSFDLAAGDIAAGQVVELAYDGTNYQVISYLLNPEQVPIETEFKVAVQPYKLMLNIDGSYTIPAGRRLRSMVISPSVTGTIKAGVTAGGDELLAEEEIIGGTDKDLAFLMTCRTAKTIYFTGIPGTTEILIYTDTLTPVNP